MGSARSHAQGAGGAFRWAAMHTVLFDDIGDVWDARSRRLADALGASLSADELTKYAVRNLGFIAAAESDGSVRLRLRPAVVSPTALGALIYWLHDRSITRVLLSFLDGEWSHELVASRDDAVRRLLARVKTKTEGREGDFLNRSLPLHDLTATSPLRAALQAWSDCAGTFDAERLNPLLEKALGGRFVLVEAAAGSQTLVIKGVGSGLAQLAEYWLSRTIGLRVEDQPDYAYGKWVAGLYHRALRTGEPFLEDVDAVVRWPQQPRQSYRYRRLVLPFERGRNSTLLLGTSTPNPDINLRVKAEQEIAEVG